MKNSKLNYKDDLQEGFSYVVKDVALKAILFGMVFYIINSDLMNKLLRCLDGIRFLEKNLIQSIIFTFIFYLISINL
jgi:hypothetical protein